MTPFYDLNQQFSPMPLIDGDHDDPSHLHPFPLTTDHASSVPCHVFFDSQQAQEPNNTDHSLQQLVVQHQQEQLVDQQLMIQGSSNSPVSFPTNNTNNIIVEESLCDQHTREEEQKKKSGKWMSSKMRIMRKMMSPDGTVTKKPRRNKQLLQDQQPQRSTQANDNSNNSPSDGVVVRVCSDCNTTKTPLWRSGPSGPKSLCNACGIRQRKARRAVAAAAALSSGLIPTAAAVAANKVSDVDCTVPFKKRFRFSAAGGAAQRKLCFDDIVIRLSKSSAFHRVFPQDEKDAAILLMALSCGLMCS